MPPLFLRMSSNEWFKEYFPLILCQKGTGRMAKKVELFVSGTTLQLFANLVPAAAFAIDKTIPTKPNRNEQRTHLSKMLHTASVNLDELYGC